MFSLPINSLVFLLVVGGALWFINRYFRAATIQVGPHEVDDAEDHKATLLQGYLFLLIGLVPAGVVLVLLTRWGALPEAHEQSLPLIIIYSVVAFLFIGLGLSLVRSQLAERRVAAPARLVASEWPVAPGRSLVFQMTRVLRTEARPTITQATLALKESVSRGKSHRWEQRFIMELPEPEVCYRGGALEATWRVTMPTEAVPPHEYGPRWLYRLRKFRWELHVPMPVPDLPDLDAHFNLVFAHREEASVYR